jgi:dolichyldiphosphatase
MVPFHPAFIMVLKTLQLTYVLYEDNPIDKAFALLTFFPFVVLIGLFALLHVRRCAETAFAAVGLVASTTINLALKHAIQQPRPPGSHRGDYGMPSDHSQFTAFFAVYIVCWLHLSDRVHWRGDSSWTRWFYSALAIAAVPVIMYSRVRLGVHSLEQVLAGAFLGALFGAAWHSCGQRWVRPRLYPWVAGTRLGQWLRVRDAVAVVDAQLIESETARVLAALAAIPTSFLNASHGDESASTATFESRGGDMAAIAPHLLGAAGIDECAWALLTAALDAVLPLAHDSGPIDTEAANAGPAVSTQALAQISRIASRSSSSSEQRARSAAAIAYAIVHTSDQRARNQNRVSPSENTSASSRKHAHAE